MSGGGPNVRSQVERLKHLCARLGTADCLCKERQMMIISFPVFFREDKKKKKNWIVSRTGGSSVTSERAQEVLAAHDGRA